MNTHCKRASKSKSKPCQKVITVKEMLSKKDLVTNKALNIDETQNESFEMFKSYGAKPMKKVDSSQSTRHMQKATSSPLNESINELYTGLKTKPESKSCDGSTKSDDSTDELFADFKTNNKPPLTSDPPLDESNNDNKYFDEILRDGLSHSCPVCFRKNNFAEVGLYINHLKSCAYKNKITVEQLRKALELQLKQTSERVALGLPVAPKDKPQKKTYPRTGTMDSNLELAIALSTSLRESEIMNKIQEKETLVEAGIEPETFTQFKNLEDFGFATSKPVESTSTKFNRKTKVNRNAVLFSRTQEERERIITEKVAMLLIDCDDQNPKSEVKDTSAPTTIKSRYLNQLKDEAATLWKKSTQEEEEDLNDLYYVQKLSNFISPCKVPVGAKLRHLSQIPCRSPSPNKPSTSKSFEPVISPPPSPPPKKPAVVNLGKKFTKKLTPSTDSNSKLRQDWKYMLNKNIFSDLIIYAKNEVPIFAHKLVFYARCRSILTETITETENGQSKEILMWMEYSYEAIIIFLEYIYTGTIPALFSLADEDKKDLRELSNRYQYREVIDAIDDLEEPRLFVNDEDVKSPNRDTMSECQSRFLALKGDALYDEKSTNTQQPVAGENYHNATEKQMNEGKKNLQILLETMQTQPRSPEMFSDEDFPHESADEKNDSIFERSTIIEDVISKLCSPVPSPKLEEEIIENDDDTILPLTQLPNPPQESFIVEKSVEKRKSLSPLEKSIRKKSKILDKDYSFGNDCLQSKHSPPISISDVSEVSDSDESMLNMKNENYDEKNTSHHSLDPVPSTSKVAQTPSNEQSPYIGDDWEAFEDFNNINDIGYFPVSDPIPIASPILEPTKRTSLSRKSIKNKADGDSLFDSFCIDEDILNRIETDAKSAASQKPAYSTPESVRRFQRRSKSETSITPVNKRTLNIVTPLADYSNMKNEDLKKELEKYGLKPGLSRNKAKLMLRYIYDQLHPFEDEIQPSIQNCITTTQTNSSNNDKVSNRNTDSYDSSDSETSGISLLEETYVEEVAEVCTQDTGSNTVEVGLDTGFKNLLREDESLHRQILLYEPVWLEPLKTQLKEYGAKCSMSELMNYLDEKCVTFRSQQNYGKYGKKSKKKSSQQTRATKRKNQNSESSN